MEFKVQITDFEVAQNCNLYVQLILVRNCQKTSIIFIFTSWINQIDTLILFFAIILLTEQYLDVLDLLTLS